MTKSDVTRIFSDFVSVDNMLTVGSGVLSVDDFLDVVGFANAPDNPSKVDMHNIDGGVKGYTDLIEQGVYS